MSFNESPYFTKYFTKDLIAEIPGLLETRIKFRTKFKPFKNHSLIPRLHKNYYIINKNPPIICTSEWPESIRDISKLIGKKNPATFIIIPWLSIYNWWNLYKDSVEMYKIDFPKHKIIIMCNEELDYKIFKSLGINSFFCNQNALIDTNIFKIRALKKKYDVIYNARLAPTKRHYLLSGIKSKKICLISAQLNAGFNQVYLEKIKKIIPNATLLNYANNPTLSGVDFNQLPPQLDDIQVSKLLNNSRVGVILSRIEGSCYASTEYLLAGIPVVSTNSRGGRDIFFSKEYCITVFPSSGSVKNAVNRLICYDIDPIYIRNNTLLKIKPHLERFKNILQKEFDRFGISMDVKDNWENIFVNKMIQYANDYRQHFFR